MSYKNEMRSVAKSRAGEGRQEYLHRILQRQDNLWMVALAYGIEPGSGLHYRAEVASLVIEAGGVKAVPEILEQMDACLEENERIEFYWHGHVQ